MIYCRTNKPLILVTLTNNLMNWFPGRLAVYRQRQIDLLSLSVTSVIDNVMAHDTRYE